jgi:hypothetical protein
VAPIIDVKDYYVNAPEDVTTSPVCDPETDAARFTVAVTVNGTDLAAENITVRLGGSEKNPCNVSGVAAPVLAGNAATYTCELGQGAATINFVAAKDGARARCLGGVSG